MYVYTYTHTLTPLLSSIPPLQIAIIHILKVNPCVNTDLSSVLSKRIWYIGGVDTIQAVHMTLCQL